MVTSITQKYDLSLPKDLSKDWQPLFDSESNREVIESIQVTLARSTAAIYPPANDVWNAYKSTPLDQVKVVILGQDPYHGPGQAHGLSFSVSPGIKFPPSLRNIFKELKRGLDVEPPLFGDLSRWAKQGVFLLNSFLTVEANKAGSHRRIGWEQFTDSTIQYVSENTKHTVFMLWGNHAQSKRDLIDKTEHLILEAPHPSPLSAHRGFLGCDHFSEANKWLESKTGITIDWSL